MICTRCGGLMQWARMHWRSRHWLLACLACGERIDETILAHRRGQARREVSSWKTHTWEHIRTLVAQKEVAV